MITMFSCATTQCPEGTVCIDLRSGDTQVTGTCLATNCANTNSCQLGDVCTLVPDEFRLDNISSVCVPGSVQFQFGTETCEQSDHVCPSRTICQEAFLDDLLGTICVVSQPPTDCSQVNCREDEECLVVTSFASRSSAHCLPNNTFPLILPSLEFLGIVESSTTTPTSVTPTELLTTLSGTLVPPTPLSNTSCPFTCSFGTTCEFLNGFPTCVQPTTCTNDFTAFCMQTGSVCRESNGTSRCVSPSSCEELATVSPCPNGSQCFVIPPFIFPGLNDTTATCLPLIGRSCEEITCSENEVCIVTELAERELTAAQCELSRNVISLIPETCATLQCNEGSMCVDLQINGFPVTGACLETNCGNSGNNTACDGGSRCIEVPSEFEIPAESLCVPFNVAPQFGTQTCAENGRVCESFQVCNEAFINGSIIGTACSQFSSIIASTCQDSMCGDGEECILTTVEGFGTVQNCLSTDAADTSAMFFEFIFANI
ncbi:fibropellin-1-like isoform X1 [Halichondria panicea]|uniref:fibropellin-1-like isoform X1 n=1 Tax=Halichondria panicea TaxID=6063 RepID=UPI00312BA5D9